MVKYHQKLYEAGKISPELYHYLDVIESKRIVSVYGELRLLLYLGILLFTGGVGYFAYQNIGNLGHLLLMLAMLALIVFGLIYLNKKAKPYSNQQVMVEHIYFDYVLLLVSLVCISLLSYIQIYFDLYESLLNYSSFFSALLFFGFAYRYDNRGVLSLGITVLAAAIGISISPVNWVTGDWQSGMALYNIGIMLGLLLLLTGFISSKYQVKAHYRFTYQNFGYLILYAAFFAALFESNHEIVYSIIALLCSGIFGYLNWKNKDFLFFLYSSITFYVFFTYLLIEATDNISSDSWTLYIYYFPISIISYIILLINKKDHFKND